MEMDINGNKDMIVCTCEKRVDKAGVKPILKRNGYFTLTKSSVIAIKCFDECCNGKISNYIKNDELFCVLSYSTVDTYTTLYIIQLSMEEHNGTRPKTALLENGLVNHYILSLFVLLYL